MARSLKIEPARSQDWSAVLGLAFRHLEPAESADRAANALKLLQTGELVSEGILTARRGGNLLGVLLCLPVPGASGLLWPPQTAEGADQQAVEDALVRHAVEWLRRHGARLGQALLGPGEVHLGGSLCRNGFEHITNLWFMRHWLNLSADVLAVPERLTLRTFVEEPDAFRQTLPRTYEGTQDCPEVSGVRTIDEVLAGHRAQGRHDPQRWWLARAGKQPVGVLMLTELTDWDGWDVAYVGVVPEARGKGVGKELMARALLEARAAGVRQLTLSVDARNEPAWQMYTRLGFEPVDRREVFLAVWDRA